MLGTLKPADVEDFLNTQVVGRIATHADGETYIVPISYAYDGQFIYCHTNEGKKINMMRKNPKVCFEVDELKNMGNWKSVITHGVFEELKNKEERNAAMHILLNRNLPLISSVTTHLGEQWPFEPTDISEIKGIVFRIRITEKTGRFESTSKSPELPG